MKIGMIGLGNMGSAIGKALYQKGYSLVLSDKNEKNLELWQHLEQVEIGKNNSEVIEKSDVVFFAVKPHILPTVLQELKDQLKQREDLWIISMAAGVTLEKIMEYSNHKKIIRIMPNTPAFVGEGMTAMTYPKDVNIPKNKILPLLESFGKVAELEENMIDAFTGACGCLPAYVFLFLEGAADGAVLEGLPREDAYEWIAQTILGSAKLYLETKKHPGVLKDSVTSPGGSTIEGVKALEKGNFRATVMNAIEKSVLKNKELGKH
ncbi:MAG: pyrroline-5-carboxylate reductase [Tissierellia bacterium]|nr:pyrroline-5-carboxylate reductase [Tissierellia bacterium]